MSAPRKLPRPRRRPDHPGNYVAPVLRLARGRSLPVGTVSHVIVEHDGWCGVFDGKPCDCVPSVRLEGDPIPDAKRN